MPIVFPSRAARAVYALISGDGWTALRLSRELGVSHTTVPNWIDGTSTPRLETAVAMARRYGIPVEDWIEPDE